MRRNLLIIALAFCFASAPQQSPLAGAPLIASTTESSELDGSDSGESWTRVRGPESVAPSGWRRTMRGWELSDRWPSGNSHSTAAVINSRIRQQTATENQGPWLRRLSSALRWVQSIDPVTLVALQITILALLGAATSGHPQTEPAKPAKPAVGRP